MTLPLQVTFREMGPSDAMEEFVRQRAERLQALCPDVDGCRVVVAAPHRHHQKGRLFRVRVSVSLPGRRRAALPERARHAASEDAYLAVRNAFRALRRDLVDAMRRRRVLKRHGGTETAVA